MDNSEKNKSPPKHEVHAKAAPRFSPRFCGNKPHQFPSPAVEKDKNAKTDDQSEADSPSSPQTDVTITDVVIPQSPSQSDSLSDTPPAQSSPSDSFTQKKVRHEETPPPQENTRLIMLKPNFSKFRLFARRPKQLSPSDCCASEPNASPSSESSPPDSQSDNLEPVNPPSPGIDSSGKNNSPSQPTPSSPPPPQPSPPSTSTSPSSSPQPPSPSFSPPPVSPPPSVTTPSPRASPSPSLSPSLSPPEPSRVQKQSVGTPRFSGSAQNRSNLEAIYEENQRKMARLRQQHQQMDGRMQN